MKLFFEKYQATGNDFIVIDSWQKNIDLTKEQIKFLCDRHFGIGSDGILILKNSSNADFQMIFYNPDGSRATFCGNGARCITKFAFTKGYIKNNTNFIADDGYHEAVIKNDTVEIKMSEVKEFEVINDKIFLNTGTPHLVAFIQDIDELNLIEFARPLRYTINSPIGTNVNVVEEIAEGYIKIRTYEKGVENETLSCGSGTVASAIAFNLKTHKSLNKVKIKTLGGNLEVSFDKKDNHFFNIWLSGPAQKVFEGQIEIY